MPTIADLAALVDGIKRTVGNSLAETVRDPRGLLDMRLSQLAESLPARQESIMPGANGGGLLSRPSMMDWGQNVALNASGGLLGTTAKARPVPRGESVQDAARRAAEENYQRVAAAPDVMDVPIGQLHAAMVYLGEGITSLSKHAQRGEPYNKQLLEAMQAEWENLKFAIKIRGGFGDPVR